MSKPEDMLDLSEIHKGVLPNKTFIDTNGKLWYRKTWRERPTSDGKLLEMIPFYKTHCTTPRCMVMTVTKGRLELGVKTIQTHPIFIMWALSKQIVQPLTA